jgi:hypothetical protein
MEDAEIIRRAGAALLSWILRLLRPCKKDSCSNGGIK